MKKRKKEINNVKIFSCFLVVIVVGAILTYTLKNKKDLNVVEGFFKDCIVEVQSLFAYPFKSINNLFSDFNYLRDVLE